MMEQNMEKMYRQMNLEPDVIDYCLAVEGELKERFEAIDRTAEYNQLKVIQAMQKNKLAAEHFSASTGYGYDDA